MKSLILSLSLLSVFSFSAHAMTVDIQKVPGKVVLSVDSPYSRVGVDVLFVVDNSGSMAAYQDKLAKNADLLISQFKNINVHAGVLTTTTTADPSVPKFSPGVINWVSTDTAGWEKQLKANFLVGVNGAAVERPFDSILLSINKPALNQNTAFFRGSADLVVILVTDADDQSVVSTADFITQLNQFKGGESNIGFHGLVLPTAGTDSIICPRDNGVPLRIEEAIAFWKGIESSLCEAATMQKGLQDIGADIQARAGAGATQTPYFVDLPLAPDITTVAANFGSLNLFGGDMDSGWIYNSVTNQLIFGGKIKWYSQPKNTKLQITYVPAIWQ